MSDEVMIKADHVSKTFKLPHEKNSSIKSVFINFYRRKKTFEMQHALQDLNFEIKKGEFFGIVGRNGSGKSTLLKLLAGIYTPTSGTVTVNGKLTPFIELGVGFNPELTGRENVFLNGALLGFSRSEMNAMYDEIVEFAELTRFMDQKLKNYSSGMQVRLAFSIAIRANTPILLIDEVLAVGDANFQKKCFDYFDEIRGNKTVVFVSHDMGAVKKYCDRALLLEKSHIIDIGKAEDIALRYGTIMTNEELSVTKAKSGSGVHVGPRTIKIEKVVLANEKGETTSSLKENEPFKIRIEYDSEIDLDKAGALFSIFTSQGTKLFSTNSKIESQKISIKKGSGSIELAIQNNPFGPGVYKVNVGIFDEEIFEPYDHFRDALDFKVIGNQKSDGHLSLDRKWTIRAK